MTPKLQSIISYLGIFWLVAFFAGQNDRNDLSRYHLKQGFGLLVVALILNILVSIILVFFPFLMFIFYLSSIVILIFMVFGIITASTEVKRPLPIIGSLFEDKFKFIDQ